MLETRTEMKDDNNIKNSNFSITSQNVFVFNILMINLKVKNILISGTK